MFHEKQNWSRKKLLTPPSSNTVESPTFFAYCSYLQLVLY